MSEPRLHHYISQCYLKAFTKDGTKTSQLFAINLTDGWTFSTTPRNVGAERDFNRVEGLPAGEIEQAFSSFEAEVASALVRIRLSQSIENDSDWNAVLNLMSLFAVRNPRFRETMRSFIDQVMRTAVSMVLATPERWEVQVRKMKAAGAMKDGPAVSYEQLKDFHDRGEYDISVSTASHIGRELDAQDTVLQANGQREWTLCIADPKSGGFITCDHPVCLIHSDGRPPGRMRPAGFGTLKTTVIFSLSPELLVLGTFEGAGGVARMTPLQVAFMNTYICGFAERQIYARDSSFELIHGDSKVPITAAQLSRQLAQESGESSATC